MYPIIADSAAHGALTGLFSEEPAPETEGGGWQASLEWIEALPQKLKDIALLRFCNIVEAKPTLVESFCLNQVLYRTISGGTFTESAENVAARTGLDRKTILKGLSQAVSQHILEENKRPGTSNEYAFRPTDEWKPEPVRKTDIRKNNLIAFPALPEATQAETEQEAVLFTDYLETIPPENEANHWRETEAGAPPVYMPPPLDQDTGTKIELIHEVTHQPRPSILKNAVDMYYDRLNRIPSFITPPIPPQPAPMTQAAAVAVMTQPAPASVVFDAAASVEDIEIEELGDVLTQIKLGLRIPIEEGMKASIKRYWKGSAHFNHALASCVETAEWLEKEGKMDREKLFGLLIIAMKEDRKPKKGAPQSASPSSQKLENAGAYAPASPGQQPDEQQLHTLRQAKEKGLIHDLFDSAGDNVLKVIDKLGLVMPWYDWMRLQPQ